MKENVQLKKNIYITYFLYHTALISYFNMSDKTHESDSKKKQTILTTLKHAF